MAARRSERVSRDRGAQRATERPGSINSMTAVTPTTAGATADPGWSRFRIQYAAVLLLP